MNGEIPGLAGVVTLGTAGLAALRQLESGTSVRAGVSAWEPVAGPLEWTVAITFDVAEATAAAFGFCWHDVRLHYHRGARPRQRCPACYPRGRTRRLCIDGREYARRRRARKRRR